MIQWQCPGWLLPSFPFCQSVRFAKFRQHFQHPTATSAWEVPQLDLLCTSVDNFLFWVLLGRSTASSMYTLGRVTYPEHPTWNLAPGDDSLGPT